MISRSGLRFLLTYLSKVRDAEFPNLMLLTLLLALLKGTRFTQLQVLLLVIATDTIINLVLLMSTTVTKTIIISE